MPTPRPDLAAAAAELASWYRRNARDLPWRRDRDPYRVLVSEVMLQQTRVQTVVPRFEAFVARFPDLRALAAADEQEVLAAWSGLGYYRRARNLHAAARCVCELHGGELPGSVEQLRALPGTGAYTAAAVAAIAFDAPVLAIDGNVERVLCRLLGITSDPKRAATRHQLRQAAAPLLRRYTPGDFNQALMDLGANVCVPGRPRCDECPCASHCVARRRGDAASIPAARKQSITDVQEAAAVIVRDDRFLLMRGQRPGTLRDMWEFPTLDSRLRSTAVCEGGTDVGGDETLAADLREHLAGLGLMDAPLQRLGQVRHAITTRRIRCVVFEAASASTAVPALPVDVTARCGWFTRSQLLDLPLAASTLRILKLLDDRGPARPGDRPGPRRRGRAVTAAGLRGGEEAATF